MFDPMITTSIFAVALTAAALLTRDRSAPPTVNAHDHEHAQFTAYATREQARLRGCADQDHHHSSFYQDLGTMLWNYGPCVRNGQLSATDAIHDYQRRIRERQSYFTTLSVPGEPHMMPNPAHLTPLPT